MRISTNMIFESNINALNDRSSALLRTQQQVSSGKRILVPSDDPVAAAQVLELTQSAAVNTQYQAAQGGAKSTLGIIDGQLSSVTDILAQVRQLGVQAGNASLSSADRKSISTQLRSSFDQLIGIANSSDGNGQYLFSGYQGANKPFAGSVENGVTYQGDSGQRTVRVSSSELMPISAAGNDLFMNVKNGNGLFVTGVQTQHSANTGTATIDAGTVSNPVKWTSSANPGKINVTFWADAGNTLGGGAGAVYYDLVDSSTGNSLFTGAPSTPGGASYTAAHAYTSGAAIPLSNVGPPAFDFGASVVVSGTPASGDSFVLSSASGASNGYFSTGPAMTAASNAGSALIDTGSIIDPSKWNSPANSGQLEVRMWQNPADSKTYYDLVDAKSGLSLFTGTNSTTGGANNTFTHAYTSGDAISFSGLASPYNDFGVSVTITGTPASGDSFTVNRSTSSGLFATLTDMINAVETPNVSGPAGNTQLQNNLSASMNNLSQVEDNVLRVRSDVGSRLAQLDNLTSSSQGTDLQYQTRISDLQNVDYNTAITDLTRYQTQLQATQQSFVKISGLSLFNYLP